MKRLQNISLSVLILCCYVCFSQTEADKEFDLGSKINIEKLSKLQHQSLIKLGKVWGFLKYYHPVVRKGEMNWDYELFRVLPGVLEAKSEKNVNQLLLQWVTKQGPLDQNPDNNTPMPPGEVKFKASLEWIKDQKYLSGQLSDILLAVQRQKREYVNYYVTQVEDVGNPRFKNEKTYPNIKYPDDGFMLLSLYRYWNMVEYFFPYKYLTDQKWDDVLNEFIPRMINVTDDLSYKLTLLELIGKVQDTHANIWQRDETLDKFFGKKMAPVELKFIEGQPVVTRITDKRVADQSGLKIGDIVTHINDIPIRDHISQKMKYSPASNLPTQYRDVARKLLRSGEDFITVTVLNEVNSMKITIPLYSRPPSNFLADIPSHKILENNIGYIYPGTLAKGEIRSIMQKLMDTKGLIIDLRCYPSDFIVFSLSEFLNPKPVDFVKFSFGSLENPGNFFLSDPLKTGTINSNPYTRKVIIIVNETTQSQAEYTTMALRASPNATVIGSTTAGADGNISEIYFPGNVRTMFSGIGVYYPDGKETQRIGIVPDIEIKPTIAGIRSGKDELLEKAIALIGQ